MKRGSFAAKAASAAFAVYMVGVLVWGWSVKFRPELDKPLLVLYLSLFSAAFLAAAALLLRWAWRTGGEDDRRRPG